MESMIHSQKSVILNSLAYTLLESAAKEKTAFAYKKNEKIYDFQPDSFTLCGIIYIKEEDNFNISNSSDENSGWGNYF